MLKEGGLEVQLTNWLVGFAAAAVCGILAIQFIKLLIKHKKFYVFGIYCLAASALAFLTGFHVI